MVAPSIGSKQLVDHLAVRQRDAKGLGLFARDADGGLDGGDEVGRGDGAVVDVVAARRTRANHLSAADAAAEGQGAVTVFPVVAARLVVDLRRTAELAEHEDERR